LVYKENYTSQNARYHNVELVMNFGPRSNIIILFNNIITAIKI